MMKPRIKKCLILLLVLFAGIGFFGGDLLKSNAADGTLIKKEESYAIYSYADVTAYRGTTKNSPTGAGEGWIFAGWYEDAECTKAYGTDLASGSAYAKFVPEKVLSVKLQLKESEDKTKTNMRLVSSVDSPQYNAVGFEVYFNQLEKAVTTRATSVFSRIAASPESGVVYNYGPKVVDVDSTYFVTATLTGISSGNYEKPFYIRPYWETSDGTTVYGVSRYVTVNNGYSTTNINIPVKMTGTSLEKDASTTVKIGETTYPATVAHVEDNGYAHLNFDVTDRNNVLSSVSTVELAADNVSGTAIYRNLHTTHAKVADTITSDKSWYNSTDSRFVIATSADLYGFAGLVNGGTKFESNEVYLAADIQINDGTASLGSWTANEGARVDQWAPIGKSESVCFNGTFDGFGHSISGLYAKVDFKNSGLFGYAYNQSIIKNLQLKNSCVTGTTTDTSGNIGSIAGSFRGSMDNIFVDEDVYISSPDFPIGGVVGIWDGSTTASEPTKISNVQFAGTVNTTSGSTRLGGIVGRVNRGTNIIQNCVNNGTVGGSTRVGGFVGTAGGDQLTIDSCIQTGTVTSSATGNAGSIIGNVEATKINLLDVYTVDKYSGLQEAIAGVGNANGKTVNGIAQITAEADLKGESAYYNTSLDIYAKLRNENAKWNVVNNAYPVLADFATEATIKSFDSHPVTTGWYKNAYTNNPSGTVGSESTLGTVFTIRSAADMYGLAKLVDEGDTFDGMTVQLGNDIILNDGVAKEESWEPSDKVSGTKTVKAYVDQWTPIGTSSTKCFNGVFDGAGHKISGLVVDATGSNTGLFGYALGESVVKNLHLENSYLKNTTGNIGSVAGVFRGSMDNIYVDEDVYISSPDFPIGGVVGVWNGSTSADTPTKISNVQYEGTVSTNNKGKTRLGGIVGNVDRGTNIIENCVNNGIVKNTASTAGNETYVGGMVGTVVGAADSLELRHCMQFGTVTSVSNHKGSIIGYVENDMTMESVYTTLADISATGGRGSGLTVKGVPQEKTTDELTGANVYVNTSMDVSKSSKWCAVEGEYPVLRDFTEKTAITSFTDHQVIEDWYWNEAINADNAAATEFTISTAGDLYGLAKLVNDDIDWFSNNTVRLANDIVLNEGTATKYGWVADDGASEDIWDPIGGKTGELYFNGTFDGQNHSVSGMVVTLARNNTGLFGCTGHDAEIKNLYLKNSYVTNTAYASNIGSLVGYMRGSLDNICVNKDVYVYSDSWPIGGVAGRWDASEKEGTPAKISNVQYEGTVTALPYYKDGVVDDRRTVLGGITGQVNSGTGIIENCVNTGTVTRTNESAVTDTRIGGFVGQILSGVSLTINTSIQAGTVINPDSSTTGAFVGKFAGKDTLTFGSNVSATLSMRAVGSGTSSGTANTGVARNTLQGTVANMSTEWGAISGGYPELNDFLVTKKIPALPTDFSAAVANGFDTYQYTATDTDGTQYAAYIASLEEAGFAKHSDNGSDKMGGMAEASAYTKGDLIVTLSHAIQTDKTYVTVSDSMQLSEHLTYDAKYIEDNIEGKQTKLHMLYMQPATELDPVNNGTSFVIELKNGHFVVHDGGNEIDGAYLVNYLKNLTPEGEIPVIEGWFISHAHVDHSGALYTIANNATLKDSIKVEGFYFMEPSDTLLDCLEEGDVDEKDPVIRTMNDFAEFKTQAGNTTPVYRPQFGQRYYFNDWYMDICFTSEQFGKTELETMATNKANPTNAADLNETSLWMMHTIDGTTFLNIGDAGMYSMDLARTILSAGYLTMDIYAVPHHGMNVDTNFTNYITINKALLYTSNTAGSILSGVNAFESENTALKDKVTEAGGKVYHRGDGTIVLTLPYNTTDAVETIPFVSGNE